MSQCEFTSFQASHFPSTSHLDEPYGSGGGGGYLQGGSPFSASGSPGGGRVSFVHETALRNRINSYTADRDISIAATPHHSAVKQSLTGTRRRGMEGG